MFENKRQKRYFIDILQSPPLSRAPKYAIIVLIAQGLESRKRCFVKVHDIADLAGRIGRGLMEQVFTTCRVAIALSCAMKKDWHKAESVAKEITQQTAAAAVGVSDSRISDYLNKKDYEDNAWVLAARFWHGLCANPQQLSIVADIIRTRLHHKLATIDKMDAVTLHAMILPHFLANSILRIGATTLHSQ